MDFIFCLLGAFIGGMLPLFIDRVRYNIARKKHMRASRDLVKSADSFFAHVHESLKKQVLDAQARIPTKEGPIA